MSGLFKDDLTVALDDVDRTASRIVTIYDDLAALATDPELARRLRQRATRRRRALTALNGARRAAGQTPEVGDPELAHLHSLWLTLKSAVAGAQSGDRLQQSLDALDDRLLEVIRAALARSPDPGIAAALDSLAGAE